MPILTSPFSPSTPSLFRLTKIGVIALAGALSPFTVSAETVLVTKEIESDPPTSYRALPAVAGDPNFEVSFVNEDPFTSRLGGPNPTARSSGYGFRQGPGGTFGLTEFATHTGEVLRLNHELGARIKFDDSVYQVVFSMTRVSEGIQLVFTLNGAVISSHVETVPNHTRFNTLRLSSRNSMVDNILVTHTATIPEPSIYAHAR